MQDDFAVEIFRPDFSFRSKSRVALQKYEYDYMSFGSNELELPGAIEAQKRDYIRIRTGSRILSGIINSVEFTDTNTVIQYGDLMTLLDIDVYRDRTLLSEESLEIFLGSMISENYIENEDALQNIEGLSVVYLSETTGATMNLTDNIHNIYDLALKALKKYGIVIDMSLDIMGKAIVCQIGTRSLASRTIEADLKNILSTSITLKDSDDSVNKVIVIGEYDEDSESYGQTITRTYYLDADTGETTLAPTARVEPVVFEYKVITVDEETFEDDAYETAYDAMYSEECDNSIDIEVRKDDPLYPLDHFSIGQKCTIRKSGTVYSTVFTGWKMKDTLTLMFGMMRTEYTKNIRRLINGS